MNKADLINRILCRHLCDWHPLVPYDPTHDRLAVMDFTATNQILSEVIHNEKQFEDYIAEILKQRKATYGIGGFMENRTVYARSTHFNTREAEPRRLHLGVDIWGEAFTPVYAFMEGQIHSFAFNDHFGDYGATIILEHSLESHRFYSLYGHLALSNLKGLKHGQLVQKGEHFCDFGPPAENGHWPPHLHFQLMTEMEGYTGDYPGVAKYSEKELWKARIPDARLAISWQTPKTAFQR